MLFIRTPGGLSHHPDESVAERDVAVALDVGANFLEELGRV
jgi:allantoate deiminase